MSDKNLISCCVLLECVGMNARYMYVHLQSCVGTSLPRSRRGVAWREGTPRTDHAISRRCNALVEGRDVSKRGAALSGQVSFGARDVVRKLIP